MCEEALHSGMCVTRIGKYFIPLTSHVCLLESVLLWFEWGHVYEGWVATGVQPMGAWRQKTNNWFHRG